jgi:hypothetical protein
LILIAGGVLFLLSNVFAFRSFGDYILLIIGGVFLFAYFNTRPGYRVGFLIPGAILTGIGVGQVLESFSAFGIWAGEDLTAITMGLGFCLIWLLERKHWWALIPGGILVLAGVGSSLALSRLWPIILIGLGVYLLYDQTRKRA